MSARLRAAAAGVAVSVIVAALAFVSLERLIAGLTGCRSLDRGPALRSGELTWQPNQETRWKHKEWELTYRINERGFRENGRFEKPPRILALGDSWTEGYGVEERQSYPKRVEEALGVGVYNAGLQGRSPTNYIDVYRRRFARAGDFKVVTLGFDISSDIERGPGLASYTGPGRSRWSYWDQRLSCEHQVLYRSLGRFAPLPRRLSPRQQGLPEAFDPAKIPYWAYTADLIARFGDELRAEGRTLVVLLIPTRMQVEGGESRFAFNEFMAQFAKKRRLEIVDALPALRAANARTPRAFYYRGDVHWTAEGHRVAAETLAREIQRRRLLP